ncbi:hypothetical protein E2562_006948 [Oryza meyeriana var. granulata]|uniref:Uncharacterized protein n=1 Tax=Oryza meyeriana var. granulata TaxID=110450 RepID=A0A6G1E9X1_9ORYZ|nr:hypothetical protein E2562_006948 [Oryza meyeriana var. granulata]
MHGYASFSDYLYNSPLAHFSAPTATCYSSPLPYHTPPAAPMADHLQVPLPAQPLGLNLSFHGFNSVVADVDGGKASTSSFDPPLLHQPSPTSSYSVYSSPSVTTAAGQDMSSSALTAENTSLAAADPSLHRVLDDEEMAAIYSIGEQHDIQWSDAVNLVTSAWWSKLLDSSTKESNSDVLGMHFSEYYQHGGYGEDVSLPRMDLGEIEGWDAEWFS